MRRSSALLLLLALLALPGCGAQEAADLRDRAERRVEQARERTDELQRRIAEIRAEARGVGDRLAQRVRTALEDLRKAVPEAGPQTASPTVAGRDGPQAIDAFLLEVLEDIDGYWEQTFATAGRPAPTIGYSFVPPGRATRSGCGAAADDRAAFYCPADDTMYIGQRLAADIYAGIRQGFPGEEAGGRAAGDFGVSYIVAHEYAHNVQEELGFLSTRVGERALPFELQADCMAGLWGNSVFRAGRLAPGDVEEALGTVLAVGDFEVGSVEHHGTPAQRRDAWLLGFESGEPEVCREFVRA